MKKTIALLAVILISGCANKIKQNTNRNVASAEQTVIPMNKTSSIDIKFPYKIQATTEIMNGYIPFVKKPKTIYLNLSSHNCEAKMMGPDKWFKTPVKDTIAAFPAELKDAKLTAYRPEPGREYDKVHVDGQLDFMNNFIEITKEFPNGVRFSYFCRDFFYEYDSYTKFLNDYYGERVSDFTVETFNRMMERFFQIKLN